MVALPPLFWVVEATSRARLASFGRDQGIFQYVAWAVLQGDRDYRDVRDVNGPLLHALHAVFLMLGGRDEYVFRTLDLLASGLAFAFVGACLPSLFGDPAVPAPASSSGMGRLWSHGRARGPWALAAWVVLSAQYLLYLHWDLSQRESFFDGFVLVSLGLQLVAQGGAALAPRVRLGLFALAALASVLTWFGKPTYAVFTLAQLAAMPWRTEGLAPKKVLVALAVGGLGALLLALVYLLLWGDVGAFVRIYFVDVPRMYRFIWPKSAGQILSGPEMGTAGVLAGVGTAVLLVLVAHGEIPRHGLPLVLLPMAGLANLLLQKKGFPYHLHPVTLGIHLQWLVALAWLEHRFRNAEGLPGLVPPMAAAVLALRVGLELQGSPHLINTWALEKGATAELREGEAFLSYSRTDSYFPVELRKAARFLEEHTAPTDRVQTYGMDPYVLFLARRLSATPIIYAYDLDADVALAGSLTLTPTPEQDFLIRRLRDDNEADLLRRLKAKPPAAFVFIDKAPLLAEDDARADFEAHCRETWAWVRERYRPVADFGEVHVHLRRDPGDRGESSIPPP